MITVDEAIDILSEIDMCACEDHCNGDCDKCSLNEALNLAIKCMKAVKKIKEQDL